MYVTLQLHLRTMHMYTGSSGSTAAGMLGHDEILKTATLTTMEQRTLKRHYIETLKATLNTYLPTRTDRERKSNARRKARYGKQQQSQQEIVTTV